MGNCVTLLATKTPRERREMDLQTVFLVGAPRSGTTWLQNLLGAHPNIITTQETDLFSQYVESWQRIWVGQKKDSREEWEKLRFKGLPAVLTDSEFDTLVRDVVSQIYGKIGDLKPSATTLLDKDPPHSRHVEAISKYLPEARFIHLLRDGRAVVTSLRAASQGWGQSWAPRRFEEAVTTWKDHVLGARQARALGHAYFEVRYEDLLADGAAVLERLFDFCLVKATSSDCAAIYDRFTLDRTKSHQTRPSASIVWGGEIRRRFGTDLEEPDGFSGKGQTEASMESWGRYERWRFDRIAGDLLAELGYVGESWAQTGFIEDRMFWVREATGLLLRRSMKRARSLLSAA